MPTSMKYIALAGLISSLLISITLLSGCSKHRSVTYIEEAMGPVICEPKGAVSPNRNDSMYRYNPTTRILTVRQPGIKPHTFISYEFTVDGNPSSTCFQLNTQGVTKTDNGYCQNNQNAYMQVAGIAQWNPNNNNIRISPATIRMNVRALGLHEMSCNTAFIILKPASNE